MARICVWKLLDSVGKWKRLKRLDQTDPNRRSGVADLYRSLFGCIQPFSKFLRLPCVRSSILVAVSIVSHVASATLRNCQWLKLLFRKQRLDRSVDTCLVRLGDSLLQICSGGKWPMPENACEK